METHQNYFAKNLLFLRKNKKLTQTEMPDQLGIKATTWSSYENGLTEPSFSNLIKISDFFGVSIDDLILSDLSSVHLISGSDIQYPKGKSTPKSTPIGTPKPGIYRVGKQDIPPLNQPDPVASWAVMGVLKKIDEKLDQLLVSAQNKPSNST